MPKMKLSLHGKTLAKFVALLCSMVLVICGVGGVFASGALQVYEEDGAAVGEEFPAGGNGEGGEHPGDEGAGGEGSGTGEEGGTGAGDDSGTDGENGSDADDDTNPPPSPGDEQLGDQETTPDEKPISEKEAIAEEKPLEEAELLPLMVILDDGSIEVHDRAGLDAAFGAVTSDLTIRLASDYGHSGTTITVNTAFAVTIDGTAAPELGDPGLDIIQQGAGKITLRNLHFGAGSTVALKLTGTGPGSVFDIQSCSFIGRTNTGLELSGGPTATVNNCLFKDFSLDQGYRSAFYPGDLSQATITNSSFINNINSATGGAAIWIANGTDAVRTTLTIEACLFRGNKCTSNVSTNQYAQGGAIRGSGLNNSDTYLRDSVFENNETPGNGGNYDGGALAIRNNNVPAFPARIEITGCNFTGNRAGDDGGALLLEGSQWSYSLTSYVANSTFVGNQAGVSGYRNGTGGGITFYGLHNSEITHNTFYDNSSNSQGGTNAKSGGAVALDTGDNFPNADPPIASNNIFIGNHDKSTVPGYGNIWISDRSNAAQANNGNVGYDFDAAAYPDYSDGENPTANITVANVFANKDQQGKPIREYFGALVGQAENTAQRFCFTPSPRSDEMYRDGSGPFYDAAIRTDVRGYKRDHYPNAGAVEIYWTRFDPDVANGGIWQGSLPAGSISSLNNANVFYLVTTPASNTQPVGNVTTFPRVNITNTDSDYGFYGWESNQPDTPGGTDYPIVQPSHSVPSTKQHYTAVWEKDKFRVDFNLKYSIGGVAQWVDPPLIKQNRGATIAAPNPAPTRAGWLFGGWYKDEATTAANAWNFAADTLASDMTLYAKWTARPTVTYTVRFADHDGTLLKAETVVSGGSATPPANPSRGGYTFAGWSGSYTNVLSDQTVTATYSWNGSGGGGTTTPTVPTQRPRVPAPTPAPEPEPEPAPAPVVTQPVPQPAPEPEPAPEPVIPETLMNDGGVPLGGFFQTGVWSLLNLILVIVGILIALIRLVLSRRQQVYAEAEAERRTRLGLPVILTLIISLASLVVFLLLEDFSKPMAWLDNHTMITTIFFVVEMVFVALSTARSAADVE